MGISLLGGTRKSQLSPGEAGAVELLSGSDSPALFCLFLISGHTRVSFGFDSKASLQVRLGGDAEKAFKCRL